MWARVVRGSRAQGWHRTVCYLALEADERKGSPTLLHLWVISFNIHRNLAFGHFCMSFQTGLELDSLDFADVGLFNWLWMLKMPFEACEMCIDSFNLEHCSVNQQFHSQVTRKTEPLLSLCALFSLPNTRRSSSNLPRALVSAVLSRAQVATLKQGDYFGENALLRNEPRSATIKAVSEIKTLKITQELFLRSSGAIFWGEGGGGEKLRTCSSSLWGSGEVYGL